MSRKIKKHIIKLSHLKVDIEIWYSKTLSIREMDEILAKQYPSVFENMSSSDLDETLALTVPKTAETPIMLLINDKSSLYDISHEAIHLTTQIFSHIGESHTVDNDEFFAYTFSSIFEDIMNIVEKKFKNTSKVNKAD